MDDEISKRLAGALSSLPKEFVDKLSERDRDFLKSLITKTDHLTKSFVVDISNLIKNHFLKLALFFPSDNLGTLERDVGAPLLYFLRSLNDSLLPGILQSLTELELSVDIEGKIIKFKEDA